MTRYVLITFLAVLAAAAVGWQYVTPSTQTVAMAPMATDPVAGEALYQQSCASCHGANLEGQPDWRSPGEDGRLPAPPHDESGHTWHHGDGLLFTYTKIGGQKTLDLQGVDYNSGMPGFSDQLSDQQIWDILAYIKSTWPDRQREQQAARSEAERLQKEANQ